jgi:hypothetical protein
MRHTLKASFNHRSDAQHVLEELLASGYSPAETEISHTEGLGASVKHALARLFAQRRDPQTGADADGSMHGRHIVTLTADDDGDAERAIGIIERFRPLDIEDHLDEEDQASADMRTRADWSDENWPRSVYPPGTEPGSLQYRASENSHYFGVQNANSPPVGNTFEEPMDAGSPWVHPDNRGPFERGGTITAYRYARAMHASDRYRNRSWDEVEPALRAEWDAHDTSALAWDDVRLSARRGWDSISPEIDDDSYYRTHWNARYASSDDDRGYDEIAPAYLYGSEARRNEKYRSKHWDEVESDLQAEWETRHAGKSSSWENFKDAVMHGWNRIGY